MTKDEILSGYKEVYVYLEAPEKMMVRGLDIIVTGLITRQIHL